VIKIKDNACYDVKGINSYGCSGSAVICVKVFCKSSQVFIPNAFAPRGDIGANKILVVRATGISSVRSFRVYNRWGKVVFERSNFPPNSPDFGWDGTINGRLADSGVYVYTAEVLCENGVPYTFKGNVTLF
jgi:gliding motility-associated-like protein